MPVIVFVRALLVPQTCKIFTIDPLSKNDHNLIDANIDSNINLGIWCCGVCWVHQTC